MKHIPTYMTTVRINGPTGLQEFKMVGHIKACITRLKQNSPIPNFFWCQLRRNNGKKTEYKSPSGDVVTFEMEQLNLDAEGKNRKIHGESKKA